MVENHVVYPELLSDFRQHQRAWNGVDVVISEVHCEAHSLSTCGGASRNRLVVALEEVGAHTEPRLHPQHRCSVNYVPRQVNFFPAEVQSWGFTNKRLYLRQLMLLFEADKLNESLAEDLVRSDLRFEPLLRRADNRVWQLAQCLAEEASGPGLYSQLYGDGLVLALSIEVVRMHSGVLPKRRGGLTSSKLARVKDYIDAHLGERVTLGQLAALCDLSQSQFCHAFKQSTGMPPHRWQVTARIRKAQELLLSDHSSLTQIAGLTGFADQSHLTRVFRRVIGVTPALWRREHARR